MAQSAALTGLSRMRSFFDPSLIERHGAAFIREDGIDQALARLIPKAHITKGHYSCPARAELRDLVWNHMDQNHRPFIHRTYGDAIRVHIGESSAFSLTRFGNWPIVLPVFDGYFRENGFYQILCLFGLVVVFCTIECNRDGDATKMDIDWAIASHRWLRFLHGPLNRRLLRLNDVQNREDDEIRDRRVALRALGYRFATDTPDFVSSNVVANNVVFPPVQAVEAFSVVDLGVGEVRVVEAAARSYILRRTGSAIEVWPGVCPHEGAALGPRNLNGRIVKCPWHGLEYAARQLVEDGPSITLCGARLQWVDGQVRVSPAQPVATQAVTGT